MNADQAKVGDIIIGTDGRELRVTEIRDGALFTEPVGGADPVWDTLQRVLKTADDIAREKAGQALTPRDVRILQSAEYLRSIMLKPH